MVEPGWILESIYFDLVQFTRRRKRKLLQAEQSVAMGHTRGLKLRTSCLPCRPPAPAAPGIEECHTRHSSFLNETLTQEPSSGPLVSQNLYTDHRGQHGLKY